MGTIFKVGDRVFDFVNGWGKLFIHIILMWKGQNQ